MTPENPPRPGDETQLEISFAGLAQRAGAILQRMEQCTPPPPPPLHEGCIMTESPTETKDVVTDEQDMSQKSDGRGDDIIARYNMGYSSYQRESSSGYYIPFETDEIHIAMPHSLHLQYGIVIEQQEVGPAACCSASRR